MKKSNATRSIVFGTEVDHEKIERNTIDCIRHSGLSWKNRTQHDRLHSAVRSILKKSNATRSIVFGTEVYHEKIERNTIDCIRH